MERILFIIGQMDLGGAETFIMKMFRSIDRKRFQFDFVICKDGFYSKEIKKLGGKIFYTTTKSKNIFKYFNQIKNIVRKNNYKTVIRFGTSNTSFIDLLACKKGGAINLGVRTLSANQGGFLKKTVSLIFRPLLNRIATVKFAPSLKAGISTFGKKKKNLVILNNAVAYDDFKFDEKYRTKYRTKYFFDDKTIVFGHVGRLDPSKNHKFLLEVFAKYNSINKNSYLICVGAGTMLDDLEKYSSQLGISKNVIFTGNISEINQVYSAFDVFLFPSLYEGMPNSLIEAQANGLPCLYSDKITKECELSNNIMRLSLDVDLWVTACFNVNISRSSNYKKFVQKNYLIDNTIKLFVESLTNIKY